MPLYKDGLIVDCEVCGKPTPMEQLHSFILTYAMPGPTYGAYQPSCIQHYGCCHEHAIMAAVNCLLDHVGEESHRFQKEERKQGERYNDSVLDSFHQIIRSDIERLLEEKNEHNLH